MWIHKPSELRYWEITPKSTYLNRRRFLESAGLAAAGALAGRRLRELAWPEQTAFAGIGTKLSGVAKGPFSTSEPQTPYEDVTHYNNYYEFGVAKDAPARNAGSLRTAPWSVSAEGEVQKRQKFDIASLMKLAPLEERIYRHRCVEGWSIVVPWIGFPLNALIKQVETLPKATYVGCQTVYDPKQMPGHRGFFGGGLAWPYVEGLRLDEAQHPLAILGFGMYGEELPPQDGPPIRMVIPWKYGFKSIKSIVKISFVADQPTTTWNKEAPQEYGFYSNVNPTVDHPRWSQATERRIGEFRRRPTLPFNGYADQVAHLYAGMDLRKDY